MIRQFRRELVAEVIGNKQLKLTRHRYTGCPRRIPIEESFEGHDNRNYGVGVPKLSRSPVLDK